MTPADFAQQLRAALDRLPEGLAYYPGTKRIDTRLGPHYIAPADLYAALTAPPPDHAEFMATRDAGLKSMRAEAEPGQPNKPGFSPITDWSFTDVVTPPSPFGWWGWGSYYSPAPAAAREGAEEGWVVEENSGRFLLKPHMAWENLQLATVFATELEAYRYAASRNLGNIRAVRRVTRQPARRRWEECDKSHPDALQIPLFGHYIRPLPSSPGPWVLVLADAAPDGGTP